MSSISENELHVSVLRGLLQAAQPGNFDSTSDAIDDEEDFLVVKYGDSCVLRGRKVCT